MKELPPPSLISSALAWKEEVVEEEGLRTLRGISSGSLFLRFFLDEAESESGFVEGVGTWIEGLLSCWRRVRC